MISQVKELITQDGCQLLIKHNRPAEPKSAEPILLVHGFASNGQVWMPSTQETDLATFLGCFGYEVFTLDLRFRSGSPGCDWDLDDYALFDIPCALAYIEQVTGQKQVHWIGHSMGGLLAYMYQTLYGSDAIRSLVVLGSPGFCCLNAQSQFILFSRGLARLASTLIPTGRLELMPAMIRSSLITAGLAAAHPMQRAVDAQQMAELQSMEIFANISRGEIKQITSIVDRAGLFSYKYNFYYKYHSQQIKAPLLAIAGDRDFLITPTMVKQGFFAAQSALKKFLIMGRRFGQSHSYGHLDLVMGPYVHKDVWPSILGWLDDISQVVHVAPSGLEVSGVKSL